MVAGLGLSLLGLGDRLMLPALGEALELMGLRERLGLGNSLLLGTGLQPGCCITSHGAACMAMEPDIPQLPMHGAGQTIKISMGQGDEANISGRAMGGGQRWPRGSGFAS